MPSVTESIAAFWSLLGAAAFTYLAIRLEQGR